MEIVNTHNLTVKDAAHVVNHGQHLHNSIVADGILRHFNSVNAELDQIACNRESDAIRHAQQCLVFAILSPGCRLQCNALMARRFFDAIDSGVRFESTDDLYQEIASGIGGRGIGRNIRNLYLSLDCILNIAPEEMTKDVLLAYRKARRIMGIGEKTASMAVALFNQHADVFTLDVHMLRWICETVLGVTAGSHIIDDKAYRILEPWFVQWARDNFPSQSTFAVQWAIWNVRQGSHQNHLPIFGL